MEDHFSTFFCTAPCLRNFSPGLRHLLTDTLDVGFCASASGGRSRAVVAPKVDSAL